ETPELLHRVRLLGDGLPRGRHELRHLLAEDRDEDVFFRLEVEVDRARGDPGCARNVRHARVPVAFPGEDPNRGVDDLLGFLGIAHEWETESRFILWSPVVTVKRKMGVGPSP